MAVAVIGVVAAAVLARVVVMVVYRPVGPMPETSFLAEAPSEAEPEAPATVHVGGPWDQSYKPFSPPQKPLDWHSRSCYGN